jgi:3-oxoadipate enol-lactonase
MNRETNSLIKTREVELSLSDTGCDEPACLFLHYWGGSSRTWSGVINRVKARARCIALDQRGWGASSPAIDERYDLAAMANDVQHIVESLKLDRYVLVGHSMGGKVAQVVAKRQPAGLVGLMLVAPAPPTPMPVPAEQRAAMLASYQSREGAEGALNVLAGSPLPASLRNQVIEDSLRGTDAAKRAWTDQGMVEDISAGLAEVNVPVMVVIGDRDQVENEAALREVFARYLPQAQFRVLVGVGHLSPLERPGEVADSCLELLGSL